MNALKKGWVAENDGVVREINIVSGETYHTPKSNSTVSLDSIDISSLLSSATSDTKDFSGIINQLFPGTPGGIVVEYYPLSATFSVSGKDIYKIKLEPAGRDNRRNRQEVQRLRQLYKPHRL